MCRSATQANHAAKMSHASGVVLCPLVIAVLNVLNSEFEQAKGHNERGILIVWRRERP